MTESMDPMIVRGNSRQGGQRIQVPRGSFTKETKPCGCVYFHYKRGILVVKGCEPSDSGSSHRSRVVKVCGVNGCGREFTYLKDYKEHRGKHAY